MARMAMSDSATHLVPGELQGTLTAKLARALILHNAEIEVTLSFWRAIRLPFASEFCNAVCLRLKPSCPHGVARLCSFTSVLSIPDAPRHYCMQVCACHGEGMEPSIRLLRQALGTELPRLREQRLEGV